LIDTHDVELEIKVAPDPNCGYRVWVHAGGAPALRAYRVSELHLDGLVLAQEEAGE
jgi:hypothetical protein